MMIMNETAKRCIGRLKEIILDSLIQNDSKAIIRAGQVLREAGERLVLLNDFGIVK